MKTPLFVLLLLPCVIAIPNRKKSTGMRVITAPSKSAAIRGSQTSPQSLHFATVTTVKDSSKKNTLQYKKDVPSATSSAATYEATSGSRTKRAIPAIAAKILANPKVQEAIIGKGIEVGGKLVDKQLDIINQAQEKASEFLKREIKLDIIPDKGWENEDMFKPPGYHIDASVSGPSASPKDVASPSFVFPAGMGGALMNGCYGSGYQERDPCYRMKWPSGICRNMIDGAAFLGVGFDGRGKYSPESRKVSIVQRNCGNKQKYDTLDVPDTMNVHGIYDTSASMMTYESREEYRRHLQEEAGVSGSIFGFSAGVKEAWGMASASAAQKYMAVMDIDVDRYEIFMDEVKPHDLSMSFLREYLNLPTSYFSVGGPLKYQNFIQRWGTHFIKSAKFGGQLEIRKTMDARDVSEKREFEVQMEMEYKTLFASVGAKAAAEVGSSSRKQTKTTSTSVVAQGGSQDIASILSDVYSPTFKSQFKDWLKSIPQYPKAFRFQMGSITDLLNFRANDLFPEETVNWGCEGNAANLHTEEIGGKTLKYYETTDVNGTTTRYYCEFDSRQALEDAIQRRRASLKRAIEIYMEEGAVSISDIKLDNCTRPNDQPSKIEAPEALRRTMASQSWQKIVRGNKVFKVSFDMLSGLPNAFRKAFNIDSDMSRLVRFYKNKWYTNNHDGSFHLYNAFNNGKSSDITKRKMSIFGLVLTYDEADGSLVLSEGDFKESKRFFPTLSEEMKGAELARVEMPHVKSVKRSRVKRSAPVSVQPCQVKWSNALRFDPTDTEGKCLHFTAASAGTIFVMFAALPADLNSRYYVEISPVKVAIYKANTLVKFTRDINARALGDASLYQSYFVCITESEDDNTLIEYGKSLGTSDSGDIYLYMIDNQQHLNVRFYTFANDENPAKVMDSHIVPRRLTRAECKGDTVSDVETNLCIQHCHKDCDPLAGCKSANSPRIDDGCNACRVAMDVSTQTCIPECPQGQVLTTEKNCISSFDLETEITFNISTPTLHESTLCVWIKVDSTYGTLSYKDYLPIFAIYDSKRSTFYIDARDWNGHMNFWIGILPERYNVEQWDHQQFTLDQLKDYEWHHISVTWSGFNGVVRAYLDGTNVYSVTNQQRGPVYGSHLTRIGDRYLSLTGLNVWNHVLSDQKIAENALKCHRGNGNVFQWHQFYEATMRNTTLYAKPSLCGVTSENAGVSSNENSP